MSDKPVTYSQYYPPGVKRVLASGTSSWIGEVDETTVLKYPLDLEGKDRIRLEIERKILEAIGPHPRIIGLKGYTDIGMYLERATKGTLADYILNPDIPSPSILQRLSWCREIAEGLAHIHRKRALHCDLQPTNVLLDGDLHIKLSDFQGRLLSLDSEEVLLDGWSGEPCRFFCPRDDEFYANQKTDIFALGCTIYFIMMGHAVFPDISDNEDGWREKVEDRFANYQFPDDEHACCDITSKCFHQQYDSAEEIVQEIATVEEKLAAAGQR